jgi:5'-nucleotidase
MNHRPRRALASLGAALLVGALVLIAGSPAQAKGKPASTVDVQVLAFNDFHGNLQPPSGSSGSVTTLDANGNPVSVSAGGVAYLATHLANARVGHPNTITVAAGDLVGASPLLSAAFHDEPTILAMNALGLSLSSVGNHEFDEGKAELRRMQYGGCRTDDGCYDPAQPFPGASFKYLAGNVIDDSTHLPLFPPFWIKNIGGVNVGFIGLVLQDTPDIVTASGVAGLTFQSEVNTANFYAKLLTAIGVKSIVLMIHDGGEPTSNVYNFNCDAGGPGSGLTGDFVNIAKAVDPRVDVIVSGHTHTSYVCDIPDPSGQPRLVTSASSFGRLFTEINFKVDKKSDEIVRPSVTAVNHIVTRDVTPDPTETALLAKYNTLIAPVANKPVGYISADILGRGATTPEEPLGDLIADAQLAATSSAATGGAVLGITNPGGIRADLVYAQSGSEGNGVVTYGEAFTVQPFNNYLTTLDLTGAQLVTLLQQQFSGANATAPKVLQISAGLHYTIDTTKTGADKIVTSSITVNGAALDPAATYRVTVNNFLAGGGDGFAILTQGTNPLVGELDIDAFTQYLTANSTAASPIAPPAADRITFTS